MIIIDPCAEELLEIPILTPDPRVEEISQLSCELLNLTEQGTPGEDIFVNSRVYTLIVDPKTGERFISEVERKNSTSSDGTLQVEYSSTLVTIVPANYKETFATDSLICFDPGVHLVCDGNSARELFGKDILQDGERENCGTMLYQNSYGEIVVHWVEQEEPSRETQTI